MELLTSRTQMRSTGCRSAVSSLGLVESAACTVTIPNTSCALPDGSAAYSILVVSDSGPSEETSGSGWAETMACAAVLALSEGVGTNSSSSLKLETFWAGQATGEW